MWLHLEENYDALFEVLVISKDTDLQCVRFTELVWMIGALSGSQCRTILKIKEKKKKK